MKVRELELKKPNQDLVRMLEKILADAKAGDVNGMAIVLHWQGGSVSSGYYADESCSAMRMLGQITCLSVEFSHAILSE